MSRNARKRERARMRREKHAAEVAEFRGFTVKRMNAAQSRVSNVGQGSDTRKPRNLKATDSKNIRYGDGGTAKGNPRKVCGKAYAPEGTFVQFGARTKEGQLENRQRTPDDSRKMWTQGMAVARQRYYLGPHEYAGM